jgi:pimeloyl-ACP methyl ester carboxylesterase
MPLTSLPRPKTDDVTPFKVTISESDIADLHERLRRTRWPEPETAGDWSQGTPLAYARELCRYWLEEYDWRAAETRLNRFPQFRTTIDGLDIHFVHVRSPQPDAVPLVLTHGWPGSVLEFWEVIGPLTNPAAHGGDAADAFHVVCPTLPGFGFSGKPAEPGWGPRRIAGAWDQLMARLGYPRYGAQGGDWGAWVTKALAVAYPGHLTGIHLNMVAFPDPDPTGDLTAREQEALEALRRHRAQGSGYVALQSTRPQTVGYGLVDSPAALCAWITEKFHAWSDCDGDPASAFTREEMLDTIMLYWLPAAGASSAAFTGMALPNGSWILSQSPPAARFSPRRSTVRPAAGPSRCSPTCATGTNWRRAGTSPPWNSQRCSPTRCGPLSASSAARGRRLLP